MVAGQAEDLAWERGEAATATKQPKPSLADLERIHARKTGALFRAALRMGVWTATRHDKLEPDPASLASLDAYGQCFGQAFQITDDLLDVQGNADKRKTSAERRRPG